MARTASAANASGSLPTTLSKLPREHDLCTHTSPFGAVPMGIYRYQDRSTSCHKDALATALATRFHAVTSTEYLDVASNCSSEDHASEWASSNGAGKRKRSNSADRVEPHPSQEHGLSSPHFGRLCRATVHEHDDRGFEELARELQALG